MAETLTARQKQVERINQLKAKLERAQNRLTSADRKARNGQLIVFGLCLEEAFKKDGADERNHIEDLIKRHLSGRNLTRALEGVDRLKEEMGTDGVDHGVAPLPKWDEQGRIYLVVPYNPSGPNPDKDEVKGLGATYDPARTAWYISKGADVEKFRKWFPSVSRANEAQNDLL